MMSISWLKRNVKEPVVRSSHTPNHFIIELQMFQGLFERAIAGDWSDERNERLMKKITIDGDGKISKVEVTQSGWMVRVREYFATDTATNLRAIQDPVDSDNSNTLWPS